MSIRFMNQTAQRKHLVLIAMLTPVAKKEGAITAEWPMNINWQATSKQVKGSKGAFWAFVELARFETHLFKETMTLFADSNKSIEFVEKMFSKA